MTLDDDELEIDDAEELPEATPSPHAAPETEALLNRVAELIENARPMPLSASSMINKDEVLELLDDAIDRLPDELRAARWLLKEREEFLAKVRREGDDILDQARTRAERMVQRTEVVKAAEQRARQIIDAAETEARRMRHEVEDFCDQKLAGFEIVLERTTRMVQAGREKLQGNPLAGFGDEIHDDDDTEFEDEFGVFDQDDSIP
jgi:cell division septum initiation protein DivIVA